MIDVMKRVIAEGAGNPSDATGEQIELADARGSQTKEPHFRFNLFGLRGGNEPGTR